MNHALVSCLKGLEGRSRILFLWLKLEKLERWGRKLKAEGKLTCLKLESIPPWAMEILNGF